MGRMSARGCMDVCGRSVRVLRACLHNFDPIKKLLINLQSHVCLACENYASRGATF